MQLPLGEVSVHARAKVKSLPGAGHEQTVISYGFSPERIISRAGVFCVPYEHVLVASQAAKGVVAGRVRP